MSQPGDRNLLTALDHRSFLDERERASTDTITFLREELSSLRAPVDSGIWTVTGRAKILELAAELIGQAKRAVYVSANEDDIVALRPAVTARRARVEIHGVYCACDELEIPGFVRHIGPCCSMNGEIAVVTDGESVLAGATKPEETASAALTRNGGLVGIAEQYIKHEIFFNSLYAEKDSAAVQAYVRRYDRAMKKLP